MKFGLLNERLGVEGKFFPLHPGLVKHDFVVRVFVQRRVRSQRSQVTFKSPWALYTGFQKKSYAFLEDKNTRRFKEIFRFKSERKRSLSELKT